MNGIWYFDVVSPFAYLALREVEDLSARVPIVFKPVLLGALLNHWGQLGPAEIAPKRVHTYRTALWTARREGIQFRFPPAHPFNPLQLLRLLTALDGRPGAVRQVFDLIWRDGRDPHAPETLQLLRERLAITDLDRLIETSDAKTRLRRETDAAIAAGIFGVPTLRLGDQSFWGADAMPMAKAYLADPLLFADEETRRLDALPKGVERPR
ncbi:2-hydroxychromene-2-carboxylate isomerase [Rhizobiales bacterium GAS191]|jgi:2-hydroxychromene-2-carboxylate isomerase|nr:2-hydroxychromene-2-carboxylate isomerase [Rhizobiales bacterium GAS113]SEE18072.1 2-hydroxychromene-2-carboxylate isomerase [Rhizobiales bacterium GAS191]SEE37501.1 2-hydroxychromene-2-carboxylate isomerase [Rhizobiales bacterium GAS188]